MVIGRVGEITAGSLDTEARRKALRVVSLAWGFGTVWVITVFGAPLTGFARELGAQEFLIGVFGALPGLTQILQIPGSFLTERFRRRKVQFILTCLTARLIWFFVALVPFLFLEKSSRLWAFGIGMAFSYALAALATPPWTGWMNDLIARRIRGRYFARRAMLSTAVNLFAFILISSYLDYQKDFTGFAVAFAIAALCGSLDIVLFFWVPDVPMRSATRPPNLIEATILPWKDRRFRRFLVFSLEWAFAIGVTAPFFNYYFLDYLQVSYKFIAFSFAVLNGAVAFVALRSWGKVVDRHGPRAVYRICGAFLTLAPWIWILCTPTFLIFFPVNAILCAICWSGIGLAQFNYMLISAPEDRKSVYLAGFGLINGVVMATAPFVGGLFLDLTAGFSFSILGFQIVHYHLLFFLAGLLRLAAVIHLGRMEGSDRDDLRGTMRMFWRDVLDQGDTAWRGLLRGMRRMTGAIHPAAAEDNPRRTLQG